MSAKPEVPDVWEEDWESQADVCEVHAATLVKDTACVDPRGHLRTKCANIWE